MKKRSLFLVFFAAVLFLPPIFFPASAHAQGPASVTAVPAIERFDLDPPTRLAPGEALIFRITGTPRASASVAIDGVNRKIALREVMEGIYEGAYTLRTGDRVDVDSVVTGNLRLGNDEHSTVLAQPLVEHSAVAASR